MPADTKHIDLAGLRVLLEKMSPAPWRVELDTFDMEDEGIVAVVEGENQRPFFTIATDLTMTHSDWTREKADAQWEQARVSQPMQDARGIVAIVNAAGALLDRIEALEAERREARADAELMAERLKTAAEHILVYAKHAQVRHWAKDIRALVDYYHTLRRPLPPEAPRAGERAK